MVGFLRSLNIEEAIEEKEDPKTQLLSDHNNLNDPLHLCQLELEEDVSSSFSDSFLDFDSFSRWLMEGNIEHCVEPNMADLGGNPADFGSRVDELGVSKENFGLSGDEISKNVEVKEDSGGNGGSLVDLGEEKKEETGFFERSVEIGVCDKQNLEGILGGDAPGGYSDCLIEEKLRNVSLVGNIGNDSSSTGHVAVGMNRNGMKGDETLTGDEDESDNNVKSEIESLSSSSSSSSSDDEEEDSVAMNGGKKKNNVEGSVDIEEGEIVLSDTDSLVAWSDNEEAENDVTGPITSKNEIKVLPPVPSVCVTLQPHHQTLPVGLILSIIGAQVIVEGVDKHNPLNEGSILWITQTRLPLGIIDEIFGPVKNPYYIVRYNSEVEVPTVIQQGTLISFVQEFANHVLNDKNLYQKGYDASGENDEELSDDLEFSDDEKESAYRRMLKMKKRVTNESKTGTTKGNEKRQQKDHTRNNSAQDQQHFVTNQDNTSRSSGPRQDMSSNQALVSPFPHRAQAPDFPSWPRPDSVSNQAVVPPFQHGSGFGLPTNGMWSNNGFQSGLPPNNLLWMQQNMPFQFYQPPLQTNMAFQQQMGMIPGLPFNFNALAGPSNFVGSPMVMPWPTNLLDQNTQFVQGQQHGSVPVVGGGGGEQGGQSQGSQNSLDSKPSNESMTFGQGDSGGGGRGGRGRRGHHRGRGRFGGGRGRHQSR